jgi:hypothetical protein
MAESDQDNEESSRSEPRPEPLEDALFEDMDAISDAAERALTSLQGGDVPAVQAQLDKIKETADSWEDPGQYEGDEGDSKESTPDMDDLML